MPNPVSGAFNPLHQAHLEIAKFAQNRLGQPVWFEISVINVDEGALSFEQADARTQQSFGPHGLILTRAATFESKTALFKGSVFVVGVDTVLRIAQPKYYDNSRSKMERALEAFKNYQCRFLVFARKKGNKLYSGSNIDLLPALSEICDFVAPEEFHLDISSTQLRRVDE